MFSLVLVKDMYKFTFAVSFAKTSCTLITEKRSVRPCESHPAKDRKRMDGEYCHTCQCYVLVKHVLDAEIHRTWAARASSSVSTSYEIICYIQADV